MRRRLRDELLNETLFLVDLALKFYPVLSLLRRLFMPCCANGAMAMAMGSWQFCDNLLCSKSLPRHLHSPFQFNTLKSSGSEKVGQVRILRMS